MEAFSLDSLESQASLEIRVDEKDSTAAKRVRFEEGDQTEFRRLASMSSSVRECVSQLLLAYRCRSIDIAVTLCACQPPQLAATMIDQYVTMVTAHGWGQ